MRLNISSTDSEQLLFEDRRTGRGGLSVKTSGSSQFNIATTDSDRLEVFDVASGKKVANIRNDYFNESELFFGYRDSDWIDDLINMYAGVTDSEIKFCLTFDSDARGSYTVSHFEDDSDRPTFIRISGNRTGIFTSRGPTFDNAFTELDLDGDYYRKDNTPRIVNQAAGPPSFRYLAQANNDSDFVMWVRDSESEEFPAITIISATDINDSDNLDPDPLPSHWIALYGDWSQDFPFTITSPNGNTITYDGTLTAYQSRDDAYTFTHSISGGGAGLWAFQLTWEMFGHGPTEDERNFPIGDLIDSDFILNSGMPAGAGPSNTGGGTSVFGGFEQIQIDSDFPQSHTITDGHGSFNVTYQTGDSDSDMLVRVKAAFDTNRPNQTNVIENNQFCSTYDSDNTFTVVTDNIIDSDETDASIHFRGNGYTNTRRVYQIGGVIDSDALIAVINPYLSQSDFVRTHVLDIVDSEYIQTVDVIESQLEDTTFSIGLIPGTGSQAEEQVTGEGTFNTYVAPVDESFEMTFDNGFRARNGAFNISDEVTEIFAPGAHGTHFNDVTSDSDRIYTSLSNNNIAYSDDGGHTWTPVSVGYSGQSIIAIDGIVLTFEHAGGHDTSISYNKGVDWTDWRLTFGAPDMTDVAYGNGVFIFSCDIPAGSAAESIVRVTYDQVYNRNQVATTYALLDQGFHAISWRNVEFGNDTFVLLGARHYSGFLPDEDIGAVSYDNGVTWTQITKFNAPPANPISYGNGIWVVPHDSDIYYSTNPQTGWQNISSGTGAANLQGVSFGNGKFIATGDKIIESADGINWSVVNDISSRDDVVEYIPYNNTFISGGVDSEGHIIEFTDSEFKLGLTFDVPRYDSEVFVDLDSDTDAKAARDIVATRLASVSELTVTTDSDSSGQPRLKAIIDDSDVQNIDLTYRAYNNSLKVFDTVITKTDGVIEVPLSNVTIGNYTWTAPSGSVDSDFYNRFPDSEQIPTQFWVRDSEKSLSMTGTWHAVGIRSASTMSVDHFNGTGTYTGSIAISKQGVNQTVDYLGHYLFNELYDSDFTCKQVFEVVADGIKVVSTLIPTASDFTSGVKLVSNAFAKDSDNFVERLFELDSGTVYKQTKVWDVENNAWVEKDKLFVVHNNAWLQVYQKE